MPPPRLKRSNTAGAAPASLEDAEIAINQADGKLYYHTTAGGVSTFIAGAHKATHATGGSDALTPADIGAIPTGGVVVASAGTVSAPSLTFTGDTNTGIFSPSADTLRIVTGGVARVTVASNGRVGFNTTDPQNALEAVGNDVRVVARGGTTAGRSLIEAQASDYWSAPSYTGTYIIQHGNAVTGTWGAGGLANAGLGILNFQNVSAGLIDTNGAPLLFGTGTIERMRITPAGSVGIGRTSPASALDVNGVITVAAGTQGAPSITFAGDSNTGIYSSAADTVHISTGGTARLTVASTGEVATTGDFTCGATIRSGAGIQTGGSRALFRAVNEQYAVGSAYSATSGFVYFGARNESSTPDAVISSAGGVTLMTLQNGGNVGIGTVDPAISSGTGLHCAGSTLRLGTSRTPASSTATGNTGEVCWDSSYLYVCVNTNTWRRIAHSTW
jgi:hypothetical protein